MHSTLYWIYSLCNVLRSKGESKAHTHKCHTERRQTNKQTFIYQWKNILFRRINQMSRKKNIQFVGEFRTQHWKILEKYKYNGQKSLLCWWTTWRFYISYESAGRDTHKRGEERERQTDRQTQRQRTESASNSILSHSSQFAVAASNKSDILSNAMGRNEWCS